MIDSISFAKILIEIEAVSFSPDNPFTYASGLKGPIYCDNRLALSYPKQRAEIVRVLCKLLKNLEFDSIAGMATAGIPWGSLIAAELEKPFLYIRSKPKSHGKSLLIEGRFKKGDKALVVEDLVNQAASMKKGVEGARAEGLVIEDSISIVDYQTPAGLENMKELGLTHSFATTYKDLAKAALELGQLDLSQYELALSWHDDPLAWQKQL